MKQLLAYVFLIIFSFQVLPVKEIGKILFKNQLTEEIHEAHGADEHPTTKLKKNTDPIRLHTADVIVLQYLDGKVHTAIHESERLPRHYVPDILTPPPNC